MLYKVVRIALILVWAIAEMLYLQVWFLYDENKRLPATPTFRRNARYALLTNTLANISASCLIFWYVVVV